MGLDDLLEKLKIDYVNDFPKKIDELNMLFQKQDMKTLISAFHKLKGSGKTYGLPMISLLSEKLEHNCLQNSNLSQESFNIAIELYLEICNKKIMSNQQLQMDNRFKNLN